MKLSTRSEIFQHFAPIVIQKDFADSFVPRSAFFNSLVARYLVARRRTTITPWPVVPVNVPLSILSLIRHKLTRILRVQAQRKDAA